MPRLTIDGQQVEVPAGSMILAAAQKLGIDVPTLCYREDGPIRPSCMACMVRVSQQPRLVPACGTAAEDGMVVESESPAVREARKTAFELLLSDHVGDCVAVCERRCPVDVHIPGMIQRMQEGNLREAITLAKQQNPFPSVLGRICSAPCEKACRRGKWDEAIAIQLLERHAGDTDLASAEPYLPPCRADTGKRVAIIGSGPTGLTAAYFLRQAGHACVVLDSQELPGGFLRYELSETELPRDVLEKEIAGIGRLGAEFRMRTVVGADCSLEDLRRQFDAVVLAVGRADPERLARWGFEFSSHGVKVNPKTFETNLPGVFAGGDVVHVHGELVLSVAEGKKIAVCVDQQLSGQEVVGARKSFTSTISSLSQEEFARFAAAGSSSPRTGPEEGGDYTSEQALEAAERCLHCACRAAESCRLRHYAELYGVHQKHFVGEHRVFEIEQHADGVVFERGKCISCGQCIFVAGQAGESPGLTFVKRGFPQQVAAPFDAGIQEALRTSARDCARVCPTGALTTRSRGKKTNPDQRGQS